MNPARGFRPLLLVMALLLGAASAQTQWSDVPFSALPPNVPGTFAHDAIRDRIVAVGLDSTTHEFDGLSWTPMAAAAPPWPINLCYDPVRQAVVNVCNVPPETWEWRGQSWSMITNQNPPFFAFAPMVFHSRRGTIMRFGGLSGIAGSPTNELWELVGNTWHFIADPSPPPGGYVYSTLAYDAARDKLVVYGADNGLPQQPTWEWDAASGWQPGPPTGPVFIERNLTFDESRRTMVVCGYVSGFGPIQTWERESNSASWTFRVNASSFTRGTVYDPLRRRILMGGASIQAYAPVFPATLDTFAPGCPGSLGVPSQDLTSPWSRAWLGDTLDVTLRGLPTSIGIQVLGFSATSSGGVPLPADLTPFGAPGCHLRVAVDGYSILAGSNHECRFTAAVPNVSALRGMAFALQAVAPEPGWNAAGLVMTDAVFGLIGSR